MSDPGELQPSLLLLLPRELRDQIFTYALTDPEMIYISSTTTLSESTTSTHDSPLSSHPSTHVLCRARHIRPPPYGRRSASVYSYDIAQTTGLRLLRVCRQIYSEALPLFYSLNSFSIFNFRCFRLFLQGLGPQARGSLTWITVRDVKLHLTRGSRARLWSITLSRRDIPDTPSPSSGWRVARFWTLNFKFSSYSDVHVMDSIDVVEREGPVAGIRGYADALGKVVGDAPGIGCVQVLEKGRKKRWRRGSRGELEGWEDEACCGPPNISHG